MNIIKTIALLLYIFALVGCGYRYSDEDRLASMLPYQQVKITRPDVQTSAQPQTQSPQEYLLQHSGLILGADDAQSAPTVSLEQIDGNAYRLKMSWGKAEIGGRGITNGMSLGGVAPISKDGYFITACHVLTHESHWIVYRSENQNRPSVVCSKARVVFSDKKSDIAIVKVEIPTPRYLRIRNTSLVKGEPIFAGSWKLPSITCGIFVSRERRTIEQNQQMTYYNVRVTNPVRVGDSGSPMIDREGKLCGVMSRTLLGRWFKKKKPETYAVMIDEDTLLKIIEEDRASNSAME